ncbi:hypothetical protein SAM19_01083 [Brevibacillus laterosporus]|nr:hypothetical protein [Brevibacillus laterosporus]
MLNEQSVIRGIVHADIARLKQHFQLIQNSKLILSGFLLGKRVLMIKYIRKLGGNRVANVIFLLTNFL